MAPMPETIRRPTGVSFALSFSPLAAGIVKAEGRNGRGLHHSSMCRTGSGDAAFAPEAAKLYPANALFGARTGLTGFAGEARRCRL